MTEVPLADVTTLGALVLALAIFAVQSVRNGARRQRTGVDFGPAFAAFVAVWLSTEVLENTVPEGAVGWMQWLHLFVVAVFAAWMAWRFQWSLRRAREDQQ